MLKQFAIEIIPLTPMEDKLEKMNAYNELTNTNATIPIEAFDGRRRAYPGENEYVKGLMLTFFSKTVNIVFWIIMVSVTALSLYGAKSLFDVIGYNPKKGLVVIVGEEQKATVLNRVIPRYDENSRFCQKYRKAYLKKYGC